VTMTVAKPESPPLVARTVLVNVPGSVPAVKTPVALINPPLATTDQDTGVMAMMFPPTSVPTALNCWVVLIAIVAGFGVTVMSANGPAVTTTVAVPESPVPLVALTVLVPGNAPAVKIPPPSTVPPPVATDHVAKIATVLPLASLPTATNGCLAPTISVSGFGVTVMLASGPMVTMTSAYAVMP